MKPIDRKLFSAAGVQKFLSPIVVLFAAGCASHPAYYVAAPPPPPPAYVQPLVSAAEHNGFVDGQRIGVADRDSGRDYRPAKNEFFDGAPGYSPQFGGSFDQYRYYYRDAFKRGYHRGYLHG